MSVLEGVYRAEWGYIVATLIRLLGDFDVAEEAAQEAFAAAVEQWAAHGVPEHPRAWLIQTARHQGDRPAAPPRPSRPRCRIANRARRRPCR